MPTWEDVVEIGSRFPGVEESTSYGTPSLKVRGKFMCRLRTNPDALVVRTIDLADARGAAEGRPDVFFITPHYDGYPAVLVRLETIDPRAARRADRGRVAAAGAQARGRGVRRGWVRRRSRGARGQWLHAPGGDVVRAPARASRPRTRARCRTRSAARGGALPRRPARHLADAQDAAPRRRRGPRVAAPAVRAADGRGQRAAACASSA